MRSVETLIAKAIEYRSNHKEGTRVYPVEFQREVLKACANEGISQVQFSKEIGCHRTTLSKWTYALGGNITSRSVAHGKSGRRYSVSTKIEVAEQVLSGVQMSVVARKMDVSPMSVSKWVQDYQDGLYVLENVTQISRKKFKSAEILLKELDELQNSLDGKKTEIKDALKKEYEEKLALVS